MGRKKKTDNQNTGQSNFDVDYVVPYVAKHPDVLGGEHTPLRMPEYGRNVQQMIDHAITIADRNERNQCAVTIINFMSNIHPDLKDSPDFKYKLWDHLAIMSDFKLDIDYPYPLTVNSAEPAKPEPLKNEQQRLRHRSYGKILEGFIIKAATMPEGPEKYELLRLLGNHMKRQLLFANMEKVNDAMIIGDINMISNGLLDLQADDARMKLYHPTKNERKAIITASNLEKQAKKKKEKKGL